MTLSGWAKCLVLPFLLLPLCMCAKQSLTTEGTDSSWVELPYEAYGGNSDVNRRAPRLEVVKVLLKNHGRLIDIRFRLYSTSRLSTRPGETYLLDESTGERITIHGKPRIGIFPPVRLKEGVPLAYLLLDNADDTIKTGTAVTVVINGIHMMHVVVE